MGREIKFSSKTQTKMQKIQIDNFTKAVVRRKVTEIYKIRIEMRTIIKLRIDLKRRWNSGGVVMRQLKQINIY